MWNPFVATSRFWMWQEKDVRVFVEKIFSRERYWQRFKRALLYTWQDPVGLLQLWKSWKYISRAFFLSHCWHHNCNNLSFFEIFLLCRFLFSLPPPLNLVACCQIWKRERSISFVQKYFCQLISKYFPSTTTYFFLQNNSYSSNLVWHFDWDHLDSRICGC